MVIYVHEGGGWFKAIRPSFCNRGMWTALMHPSATDSIASASHKYRGTASKPDMKSLFSAGVSVFFLYFIFIGLTRALRPQKASQCRVVEYPVCTVDHSSNFPPTNLAVTSGIATIEQGDVCPVRKQCTARSPHCDSAKP